MRFSALVRLRRLKNSTSTFLGASLVLYLSNILGFQFTIEDLEIQNGIPLNAVSKANWDAGRASYYRTGIVLSL